MVNYLNGFQSTPSAREGDDFPDNVIFIRSGFNPRLPRGKATPPRKPKFAFEPFQSTPSAREGDAEYFSSRAMRQFQSTPSAREGDISAYISLPHSSCFNPRLPRGKATTHKLPSIPINPVSIHAFREGRRPHAFLANCVSSRFQSTPSAREGDVEAEIVTYVTYVSIHAFREGRRRRRTEPKMQFFLFQSTPSAREGDKREGDVEVYGVGFNPRLPRGKATLFVVLDVPVVVRFNPRLPRGKATRTFQHIHHISTRFNPRLPRGKATSKDARCASSAGVSIHAFREGRRPGFAVRLFCQFEFQSTPSAREGDQLIQPGSRLSPRFNPRLPRGKATTVATDPASRTTVSIHAFREGRRRGSSSTPDSRCGVSIHAFREGRRPPRLA